MFLNLFSDFAKNVVQSQGSILGPQVTDEELNIVLENKDYAYCEKDGDEVNSKSDQVRCICMIISDKNRGTQMEAEFEKHCRGQKQTDLHTLKQCAFLNKKDQTYQLGHIFRNPH